MINFFTLANNQMSSQQSNVDPRTGQFGKSIQLGHITGNRLRGPKLPFSIGYQPFVTQDHGFGQGWALPWTTYVQNRGDGYGTLYTSGGCNITVDNEANLQQQKPVATSLTEVDGSYVVTNASGGVEVLGTSVNSVWVPSQIFTPLGNSLSLEWSQDPFAVVSIQDDEENELLSASYDLGSAATLTLNPDAKGADKVTIRALIKYGQLDSITVGEDWTWKFYYTDADQFGSEIPQLLYKVEHPTGLVEQADYTGNIITFPSRAQKSTGLPAVTTYTKHPNGGQPPQVCTYEYQNNGVNETGNFLGDGADLPGWNDWRDNLYEATSPYRYTTLCKEMTGDGETVVSTIESTFDQFHCLRNETRTKGKYVSTTEYEYGGQVDGGFDRQLNTFLMATKVTKTRKGPNGESEPETSTSQYDKTHGDKIRHESDDGIVTEYEYYSLDGDGDNYPGSWHRLRRSLKSITTTYPAKNGYDSYKHKKVFTLCSVNVGGHINNVNDPIPYATMPHTQTMSVDGVDIHRLEFTYINHATPGVDQGRLSAAIETVYDDDRTPHISTTKHTYTHDDKAGNLIVTDTFTAEDGTSSTTESHQSFVTGLEVAHVDGVNVKSQVTYDVHGRATSITTGVDSDYARTTSFEYDFEKLAQSDKIAVPTKTTTHPSGAREKAWYDSSLRPIKNQKFFTEYSAWKDASTQTYDDQGRHVSTQEFDWASKKATKKDILVNSTVELHYNDWGHNDRTDWPAIGRFEGSSYDPVTRTETETWSGPNVGKASRVIQYNNQNVPVSVTVKDRNGEKYSTTTSVYDGGRRLRRFTDVNGDTVSLEYDVRSRPYKITSPDGSVVTRLYEPSSGEELITEIKVQDPYSSLTLSLGTQVHDGLHRVTQEIVGGRTTKYNYKDASPNPDYVIEPDGARIDYTYIHEMGGVLKTASTADKTINQNREYDPRGGWITSATDASGPKVTLAYDEWGALQSRTVAYDESRSRTETYTSSAFGRELTFEDVGGNLTSFKYTVSTGLPSQQWVGATKVVDYSYAHGELAGWTAGDSTVSLTYDEFLRETNRLVTRDDETYQLSQKFYPDNGLHVQTSNLNGTMRRQDTYEYDSRRRLTNIASEGTELTTDPYGNKITQQHFVYDGIDNIRQVKTTFVSGEDVAIHHYPSAPGKDPCQVVLITHTGPGYPNPVTPKYDASGRMTNDGQGLTLGYDLLGRLTSARSAGGNASYVYDGFDVQRELQLSHEADRELYYHGHYPISMIKHTDSGDETTSWVRADGNCMLEMAPDGTMRDVITDAKASVVATGNDKGLKARDYTAYGHAPLADSEQSALGYNGEHTDPVTGLYHLGNGYRAFSPTLMRFMAPDSLSPFGAGGLNAYAYCSGDPANMSDPSGHFPWEVLEYVGLAAAVGASIYGGWEVITAWRSIAALTEVAEDASAAAEVRTAAASAARWQRARTVVNGGLVLNDGVNIGTTVASKALAPQVKRTVTPNGGDVVHENDAAKAMKWLPWVSRVTGAIAFVGFGFQGFVRYKSSRAGQSLAAARTNAGLARSPAPSVGRSSSGSVSSGASHASVGSSVHFTVGSGSSHGSVDSRRTIISELDGLAAWHTAEAPPPPQPHPINVTQRDPERRPGVDVQVSGAVPPPGQSVDTQMLYREEQGRLLYREEQARRWAQVRRLHETLHPGRT